MLEQIALKLTAYMIKHEAVPAEDEDIYVYGWSLILSHTASLSTMLLAAALTGELLGALVFMAFMFVLRPYAGGYHADSYLKCFVLSVGGFGVALLIALFFPVYFLDWLLILLPVAAVTTFVFAPVGHPNKPLTAQRKQKNKKISRTVVAVQTILILGLWFLWPGVRHHLVWAMSGMAFTSLTLLYVVLFNPYASHESHEK